MWLVRLAIRFPKSTIALCSIITIIMTLQFPKIKIDTDPENMLSKDEYVRVFNDKVKKKFSLYDFIVLGIINKKDKNGVFNPVSLKKIFEITEKIKDIDGVIAYELISLSTKDNIRQGGLGEVLFEWLMAKPPSNEDECIFIRDEALDNPLFKNTIVSEDGKAICIFIPIKAKDLSYKISKKIEDILKFYKGGDEKFYITGLPVSEDTFGFEMFKQMAISAPLAGLFVFLIMLLFFKRVRLIISPMIVAIIVVLFTMGLLIWSGNIVHIMSSMIPIFLVPISVLDSIHIMSEFYHNYQLIKDKRNCILKTMENLFLSMLYTSLTTTAGFGSLAFTPIPPVQIFGVFVAIGVMWAWVLTMTFIPAWIMLINEGSIEGFKIAEIGNGILSKISRAIGKFSYYRYKLVIVITTVIIAISIWGILRIQVNDNPTRWFARGHRIRVADEVLNNYFGGTYPAYIVFDSGKEGVFKDPLVLGYIQRLQEYLASTGVVGKSNSITDIIRKVYYELMGGEPQYNRLPNNPKAVAQCLISYENSHKPDDLWHFVTPDLSEANIWLQMKSGDNKDMYKVIQAVNEFISKNPPPVELKLEWAGLTYINYIWQKKMVVGMLYSLLGSFGIVLIMMVFLFRSPLWGFISMVPLTITILFIYSLIGMFGKYYDMPIAVLSSLTLGLSVDFAIHMLQRVRTIYAVRKDVLQTLDEFFGEPSYAIIKNIVVIGIAFFPLLLSPLVPYKTVGFFMFAIMFTSGIGTLFIMPSLVISLKRHMFVYSESVRCNSLNCIITSLLVSFGIAFILHKYRIMSFHMLTAISIVIVSILTVLCNFISKRCKEGV